MSDDDEPMLYLTHHRNGYYRMGDEDDFTVSYQLTGDAARLFNAAPRMLEALREAEQALAYLTSRMHSTFNDRLDIVRAAIAKATGKESE